MCQFFEIRLVVLSYQGLRVLRRRAGSRKSELRKRTMRMGWQKWAWMCRISKLSVGGSTVKSPV